MRKHCLLFAALIAVLASPPVTRIAHADPNMTRVSAHAFAFKSLDGKDIRLAAHVGKPILVVNTASLCGYTPQYAGLQDLWNFHKYLIGRDGRIKASFPSAVAPNDPRIVVAIENELAE